MPIEGSSKVTNNGSSTLEAVDSVHTGVSDIDVDEAEDNRHPEDVDGCQVGFDKPPLGCSPETPEEAFFSISTAPRGTLKKHEVDICKN